MAEAPSEIASDRKFKAVHAAREIAAKEGRDAKARYRALIGGFIVATAAAAILGGLLLYGLEANGAATNGAAPTADASMPSAAASVSAALKTWASQETVRITLGLLQALCLAVAGFCAYLLNQRSYGTRWLESREKAENGRLEKYRVALEIGHAKGRETFKAAGEYFMDGLVAGQLNYLNDAIVRHDQRAVVNITMAGIAIAIGVAGSAIGALGEPLFMLVGAFVGVLSPALVSGIKSWNEASGDQERTELHRSTRDALLTLQGDGQEFDDAIAANDLPATMDYAERVFAVLRGDHEGFRAIMKDVGKPRQA